MELLDDRPPDCIHVLTLENNSTPFPVDDFFHQDVPSLVCRPLDLSDVLVTEVPEHVLHQILELEPREVVQDSHLDIH